MEYPFRFPLGGTCGCSLLKSGVKNFSTEQRKFLVEAYVSLVAYYVVGEFDTRKSAENYLKTITWNREKGFNLVLKPREEEP